MRTNSKLISILGVAAAVGVDIPGYMDKLFPEKKVTQSKEEQFDALKAAALKRERKNNKRKEISNGRT